MAPAFPDTKATIELLVESGDEVAVYGTWKGTHQGEFMGIPSTGKKIEVPSADFIRFSNGLCAEHGASSTAGS